ncbi:MAG TPA: hypothetical protein VEV83_06950 [Parafilimonas sp.]|nr:hypothetical protein [Parafilimonas sp.]
MDKRSIVGAIRRNKKTVMGGQQNIYIAKLLNLYTIKGSRVLISSPTYKLYPDHKD